MLEIDDAISVARQYMDANLEEPGPRRLAITRAELRDEGWLFFYSSVAFLQSRSIVDALGGDTPILVGPDGEAVTIGIDQIASCGEPLHPGL